MNPDIDLFIAIAEIAGVFVGFGALIGVTRRSMIEVTQLGRIRAVVTTGLVVVVAALVPVTLSRYAVHGHNLWFICSLIFLVLLWVVIILSLRRVENRKIVIAQAQSNPWTTVFFWVALEIPVQAPLVLNILGLLPDFESALYTTSLVFNLFEAAFILTQLVYFRVSSSDG
jgi:hypothetical protein